ncbi:hypothetical protein PVK06_033188 [Gossypium arboreum]|uniref:Uncharacterized protein n=1 Tax=Gossypium arboreum TaxID=29729 RepID=A0ABR0NB93_GOSAR|nr:hypothetical protein PVK06_033188 [Gossypium arboreum]
MALQLVVLALVLIVLASLVSVDASSTGGSPTSAPVGAFADGNAASYSATSQATVPSPSGGILIELDRE